ncbi:hypothetical protein UlMin_014503 [Ulmus minor]
MVLSLSLSRNSLLHTSLVLFPSSFSLLYQCHPVYPSVLFEYFIVCSLLIENEIRPSLPDNNDLVLYPTNHLSIGDMCLSLKPLVSDNDQVEKFTAAGKIISSKSFTKHSVKRVLLRAWTLKGRWDITEITRSDPNMFIFEFQLEQDRHWVIDKGPWSINGEILTLTEWDPSVPLQSIPLKFSLWWIQIHGIPPVFMTRDNLHKIGEKAGTVIDMELSESSRWKPFVRALLSINVNNPLYPGFYLPIKSQKPTWVQLKYEKLAYLCFRCVRLGHGRESCSEEADTTIANLQGSPVPLFGPWLRADSKIPKCFIVAVLRAEREAKRKIKRSPSMETMAPQVAQPALGEDSGR